MTTLIIRESVTVEEHFRVASLSIQQVIRATRAGGDRVTTVHAFDSGVRRAAPTCVAEFGETYASCRRWAPW
ncbi:hypothetical protein [Streptomyces cyaneofuscatus]|uniref:hypothetical protein n=1 Tax=Streptomyces cyaneofuscatus TaxID=66883 RepID=UPI003423B76D